jgi:hypothetical protein
MAAHFACTVKDGRAWEVDILETLVDHDYYRMIRIFLG